LNSQGKYDSAGANLGFRYEFSDTLGIGVTSSFSMHESIIIDQYREVLNPLKNIYAQGQTTAENRNFI